MYESRNRRDAVRAGVCVCFEISLNLLPFQRSDLYLILRPPRSAFTSPFSPLLIYHLHQQIILYLNYSYIT
jgi:hypothetical protein